VHIRGVGALSADERKDESWAKRSSSRVGEDVCIVGTGGEEDTWGAEFGDDGRETERRKKGSNSPLRPKPRPTEVAEIELREEEPAARGGRPKP
jgi:thiamine monophosphate kinase